MKILIISTEFLPVFNDKNEGAIQQLERMYIEFNSKLSDLKSDEIIVYSPKISKNNYDKVVLNNCDFRIIDKTTFSFFLKKCFYYIRKKIFKDKSKNPYIKCIIDDLNKKNEINNYDLIIFENGIDYIKYFKNKTNTKSKIILHLHNDYLNINTKDCKSIIESTDEIWAVSEYIKSRIKEVDSNSKIRVLYNTYNPIYDKKEIENEVEQLKKNYNIYNNYVFIYVGRIIPVKGVKELIEAYNLFCETYSDSRLFIIGKEEDSKKGKKYLKDIKKIANANVIFTGYVEPKELKKFYAISNTQIIPSIWGEAFGLILLEGMKNNIKIIANDVGALREIGKEKVIYADNKNLIQSLVDNMGECYSNKKNYPQNYYKDILNEFSNDVFLNKMYILIHDEKGEGIYE